jgi:hypothetical protein
MGFVSSVLEFCSGIFYARLSLVSLNFAALQTNRRSFDYGGKSAASAQDDTFLTQIFQPKIRQRKFSMQIDHAKSITQNQSFKISHSTPPPDVFAS